MTSCIKSLHGVLHGGLWIRFHGLLEFASGRPPRGGLDANSGRLWFFFSFQHDKFQDKLQGRFQNRFQDIYPKHTNTTKKFSQIDRVLRHIILNQVLPSFYANKICNGPATWSIITSHYAWGPWLMKWLPQHPWYGLWMRVKGPHHYKVTALGSCVKRSLGWGGGFNMEKEASRWTRIWEDEK